MPDIPEHALMHTLAGDIEEAKRILAEEEAEERLRAEGVAVPETPLETEGEFEAVQSAAGEVSAEAVEELPAEAPPVPEPLEEQLAEEERQEEELATIVGGVFDSGLYVRSIEAAYFNIENLLHEKGVDFSEVPQEMWNQANDILQQVRTLDEAYQKERSVTAKDAIQQQMESLGATLQGGVTEGFMRAVQALTADAPVTEAAEPVIAEVPPVPAEESLPEQKEVPQESAVIEKAKAEFDPVRYAKNARHVYVKIGKDLKEWGISLDSIPQEVFEPANLITTHLDLLAQDYLKEKDPKEQRDIVKHMRAARANLQTTVLRKIERDIHKLLKLGVVHPEA